MENNNENIVVIGAGIAGLTAAYYLNKKIEKEGLPYRVVLIESSMRVGGKMQTVKRDGFIIERGPDSFLARKASMTKLAQEVGVEDTLVANSTGKSYILVKEQLHSMPGGSIMGIPTQIAPFIKSGLFSPIGKARAALDFILPRSNEKGDRPLGPFLRRRLGNEVVENLIEPLLSGIYAGDLDKLSTKATFPDMLEMEEKYRSLIIGMKMSRSGNKKKPGIKVERPVTSNRLGMFRTFNNGLQSFADAIEAKLPSDQVLKGTKVESIKKSEKGYKVYLQNGVQMEASAIVVATPHEILSQLFPDYSLFNDFKKMPSTSVATVSMAFDQSAIKEDIDGTGFVVSRNCDYTITACTWTHKKWPHSTPEGKALLRCYVGREGDEVVVDLSDEEIEQIVLDDLNRTMKITEKPLFSVVSRWKNSMPQYRVGHLERMQTVEEQMQKELPGIYLAGASYDGIGMPDCIDQGVEAVHKVTTFLQEK